MITLGNYKDKVDMEEYQRFKLSRPAEKLRFCRPLRQNISRLSRYLAIAATLTCIPAKADEVLWSLNHFAPYMMLDKELPGDGPAIDFVRHAVEQMPDYNHSYEEASFSRVIGLMQDGIFACNPLLLKTPEREPFIEFSQPIIMALPHHIIVHESKMENFRPYLNDKGRLDLNLLLENTSLTTSTSKGRAYPGAIRQAFNNAKSLEHVSESSTDFRTPVRQLQSQWIDYIIAYPFEIHWYAEKTDDFNHIKLKYLPIAGMPDYALGHVGCTKNRQGKKVIAEINEIIRKGGANPRWNQRQYELMDAGARKRLEALLEKHEPFGPLP